MTNQEILKKAIQKAIDGGWKPPGRLISVKKHDKTLQGYIVHWIAFGTDKSPGLQIYPSYDIIFNHDFAKALWGEMRYKHLSPNVVSKAWVYHLQQMVIADDQIKYLGENL